MTVLRHSGAVARLPRSLAAAHPLSSVQQSKSFNGPHSGSIFLPKLSYYRPRNRSLSTQSLPRIAQPSFWKSLFPNFSKLKTESEVQQSSQKKKEWNPATFFIAMVMLIGSQAIQMIALRQDFVQFSNQTEARLAKLREVLRRIQNGEDVDVATALGTGDKRAEREWEEVIRELEQEDELYRQKRKRSKSSNSKIPDFGSNKPDTKT